jgi:UDP-glucuronate decarboxylase
MAFALHQEKKLPVTTVRLFNTVGPRQTGRYGMVVPRFVHAALKNEPITIYGDGSQTRSFCYVSDLVEGIVSTFDLPTRPGSPINLGNVNEFTMIELAEKAISICNSSSPIVFEPLPFDDPRQRKPDTTLANRLLGWSATVELNEGLEKTAEYFRKVI